MKPPFAELPDLAWSQFWQVTVVALLVGVLVRLFCRRRPHLAYLLWLLVILKCLTPPLLSSPTGLFSWSQARVTTPPPHDAPGDAVAPTPPAADIAISPGFPPFPGPEPPAPEAFTERKTVTGNVLPPPEAPERRVSAATVLGVVWLLGAVAYAGIVIGLKMRWSGLLRRSSAAADGNLVRLMGELSKRLGIRRTVRLLVTSRPLGPVAYGVLRPSVLLPDLLLTEKSPQQIDAVLAHELVHIRRHDNLMGVLQLLAQAIWWFHPLVWWANRQACRERERCCDEEAVARLGCDPGQYAQSLLDVLKLKHKLRPVFAFPGVRPGEVTSKRMEEIMEPTRRFHRRTPRWCWLLTLAAAVLILPGRGLVISLAAEPPNLGLPIGGGAEAATSDQRDGQTAVTKEKSKRAGKGATGQAESPKDMIVDPDTGLEFRRFASLTNEPETVAWHYALSPNGKFLLSHRNVAPVDGAAPFKLGDIPAIWGSWSPDGRKIVFTRADEQGKAEKGTWVVSVSPETAKPTGPPEKLLEHWCRSFSWSPDAEAVAYVAREGGPLWVHSLRDNSKVKIFDESVLTGASWSPDGKWFAGLDDTGEGILLISSDGRRSRKLVKGVPVDAHCWHRWTPDSQWVFYRRDGKLHFVRVADSLRVDVNLPGEVGGYLSWTPDGKNMLFYQPGHAYCSSLKLVDVLSGEVREPLKEVFYSGVFQHWSPDSKYLATSDWQRFWIVPVSGEEPYPLKLDVPIEGTLESESISPDGKRLIFVAKADGKREHYVVPISLGEGKTTGEAVKVFDKNIDWRPRQFGKASPHIMWSPDGSRLALVSDNNVWVVGADGRDPRQLSKGPDLQDEPMRWSADGKKITWASWSSDWTSRTWHICELPDGEPRELTRPLGSSRYEASEDGRTAIYVLGDGKKRALWVETLPRGERKKLLELEEGLASFSLWPDGTAVAVATTPVDPKLDGRFSIYSLPDGQQRKIPDLPDPSARGFSLPALSSDGRVFTLRVERRDAGNPWRCFSLSIPERKWTELQVPNEIAGHMTDWSPDRKWVAYGTPCVKQIRPEGVIWAAEIGAFLKDAVKKATAGSSPPKG